MECLIDMLKTNITELLKSEYYKEKKSEIVETGQKKQKEILKNSNRKSLKKDSL